MALAGALAVSSNLIGGFSNKTIRPLIRDLLGETLHAASPGLLRAETNNQARRHTAGRPAVCAATCPI